jgi:hypothetical protein
LFLEYCQQVAATAGDLCIVSKSIRFIIPIADRTFNLVPPAYNLTVGKPGKNGQPFSAFTEYLNFCVGLNYFMSSTTPGTDGKHLFFLRPGNFVAQSRDGVRAVRIRPFFLRPNRSVVGGKLFQSDHRDGSRQRVAEDSLSSIAKHGETSITDRLT